MKKFCINPLKSISGNLGGGIFKTFVAAGTLICMGYQAEAQLKVKPNGKAIIGKTNFTGNDPENVIELQIIGDGWEAANGKISFGKFGTYGDANGEGWRTFIGEHAYGPEKNYPSAQLRLHGRHGFFVSKDEGTFGANEFLMFWDRWGDRYLTTNVSQNQNGYIVQNPSDYRLKENITQLDEQETLEKLLQMDARSYKYKRAFMDSLQTEKMMLAQERGMAYARQQAQANGVPLPEETTSQETTQKLASATSATTELPEPKEERMQFGFIAQEVEKLFPELISKDELGYYSMNYDGLIPLTIEALKAQQQQIEDLKKQVASLQNNTDGGRYKMDHSTQKDLGILGQNSPNPFTDETTITFELPESTRQAQIMVHDMQGRPVKTYEVTGRRQLIIEGRSLKAGMYMYSLMVNDQLADTKRMILTK